MEIDSGMIQRSKYLLIEGELPNKLRWIDKLLLICPMWIKTSPTGHKRFCITNTLMIIIIFGSFIMDIIYNTIIVDIFSNQYSLASNIIWITTMSLTFISRCGSFYYFYFYFDWPWHHNLFHHDISPKLTKYASKMVKRESLIVKLVIIVTILLDIAILIEWYFSSLGYMAFINYSVFCIFILYPQLFLFVTQSAILLKYCRYLSQMVDDLKDQNMSINKIINEYHELYQEYQKDYPLLMKLSIILFLIAEVLFIFSELLFTHHTHLITDIDKVLFITQASVGFVLFVSSGSMIAECHQRLVDELWLVARQVLIDDESDLREQIRFNYGLQYVQNYTINVKIGEYIVTKVNAIKFIVLFVITTGISIFMKRIV